MKSKCSDKSIWIDRKLTISDSKEQTKINQSCIIETENDWEEVQQNDELKIMGNWMNRLMIGTISYKLYESAFHLHWIQFGV